METSPDSAPDLPVKPRKRKKKAPDPSQVLAREAEERGRVVALVVLGGLFAMAFGVELLDLRPSDVNTLLADERLRQIAWAPKGISLFGALQLSMWIGFLALVFYGRNWARILVVLLATARGSVALYYAITSGMKSGLATGFAAIGILWLTGAVVLLRERDVQLFFERQRKREPL